jgi:hypothetical protein
MSIAIENKLNLQQQWRKVNKVINCYLNGLFRGSMKSLH